MTFIWEKDKYTIGTERWTFNLSIGAGIYYDIHLINSPARDERYRFSKYHGQVDACLWIFNPELFYKNIITSPFQANLLEGKFKWGYFPRHKRVNYKQRDIATTKIYQKWTAAFNRYFCPAFSDSMLQQIIIYSNLPEEIKQSVKELTCPKGSLSLPPDDNQGSLSELENMLSVVEE